MREHGVEVIEFELTSNLKKLLNQLDHFVVVRC